MKHDVHDINSMGDFLNCKRNDCCWSATWSLGHICDHCKLSECICPCPLSKEWLDENKWNITGRKIAQIIDHDLSSEFYMINQEQQNIDNKDSVWYGKTNKQRWERRGKFEAIQRILDYGDHNNTIKNNLKSGYFCKDCKFLKPVCRCKIRN